MSTDARRIFATLIAPTRPRPSLRPTAPHDPSLTSAIEALPDGAPLRAALHLLNDDIGSAHAVAQANEGARTADYVHAQLHRREGDYWNSKWWISSGMRRAHPVMERVHGSAAGAARFVDLCAAVGAGKSEGGELEERQWEEMRATAEWALEHDA
ncbi:hypothetical protein K488DRAFT_77749 [Vararia minispora EC-137]|uniref:Uncharacterized protein n=1 Tax=Vararia minispora EC-137 TaxID=1314806 RepID=A0ACB8QQ95_9AGAM|nr:hypothetical protein K488DRAFT_77749 [Vararia minispora EC-137]